MNGSRNVLQLQSLLRRSLSIMTTSPGAVAQSASITMDALNSPTLGSHATNVTHVPIPRRGVDYRGKIVLAPMVRSGELPSRLLALHYGADLVWGPETVDKSMIGTTERINPRTGCIEWTRKQNNGRKASEVNPEEVEDSIIYRIDPARESSKLIYQIGTANPETAVASASLVAPYVAGIDVNAGCPKPFSTSGGMGAALLRTPDLLASILTNLVEKVGKPHEIGISVKIRLLETPELTSALVHQLCQTGIIGLTIHCRTTPMRPRERAIREQLRMIREICHSHGVACLMNGDVTSRDQGLQLASEYGCDGAMIATAAEANSSVFRSEKDGGLVHWKKVVEQYMLYAVSVENKFGNTKFLLSQLMPGRDPMYQKVVRTRTYVGILEALEYEDSTTIEKAKELDRILGLDAPKVTKGDIKRMHKEQNKENLRKKQEKFEQRKRMSANGHLSPTSNGAKKPRTRSRTPDAARQTHPALSSDKELPHENGKSPVDKARIAAENAGFEGVGEGALAVAV